MSSNEHGTGQARQIHMALYDESAQSATTSTNLNNTQSRHETRQLPPDVVSYKDRRKISMSPRGKRKSSSVDGDHDHTLDRHRTIDNHSYQTSSRSLPSALSARHSKKRSKFQSKPGNSSSLSTINTQNSIRQQGLVDDIDVTRQQSVLNCAEDRNVSSVGRNFAPYGHFEGHPNPWEVAVGGRTSPCYGETWMHAYHEHGTGMVDLTVSTSPPSPPLPSKSAWPHSLAELHWPFDDSLYDYDSKRGGGGGGGSQPSTTGSQGFPHFVTAGPNMSLVSNSLFGYDRSELMGCISWA